MVKLPKCPPWIPSRFPFAGFPCYITFLITAEKSKTIYDYTLTDIISRTSIMNALGPKVRC